MPKISEFEIMKYVESKKKAYQCLVCRLLIAGIDNLRKLNFWHINLLEVICLHRTGGEWKIKPNQQKTANFSIFSISKDNDIKKLTRKNTFQNNNSNIIFTRKINVFSVPS